MNEESLNKLNSSSALPQNESNTESNEITKSDFSIDTLNSKSISILGFDLHFDDIIILALILFLLQEEKKDYLLIGVLGLMFFDLSIDKISNFEPLKNLLSNIT